MKKSHVVVYSALLLLLGSVCSQAQQSLTSTRNGDSNAGSQAVSNVSGTASPVQAFGRKTMLSPCSGQVGIPLAVIARNCKPVIAGTQDPQLSNSPAHNDDGGTYVTFDAPGAVNGTLALAINPAGAVTGYGSDVNFNGIGFLRDRSGNMTTVEVPGAGGGTYPSAISDTGAITGGWCDATYVVCPGFVRDSQGNITTFDVPGEVFGVSPFAISPQGAITGTYLDGNFV